MIKTIKILSILLLLPTISFSQIQYGGAPIAAINIKEINFITIDHSSIINNNLHPMVLKYANEYSVDINVPQLATKIEGSYESTYYLGIESPGAMALAFVFDEFNLTENTNLFIYDEEKSMHIGSFNSKNNNPSGTLSTAVVKGDRVVIELTIPNNELSDLKLHISIVTHDFLDLMNFHGERTADRTDCNDNVACSSADDWGDQVDAVVMVSVGGSVCSGAIVNNTAFDLEPYIIYAAHCHNGESSTVYFNYQATSCNGNDPGNYNTMSGTETLAVGNFNNDDYALIKLNNDIPGSYGAYYAGWSRSTSSPGNNVVGIHHADGDIKKISYDAYGMNSQGNWWEFAYSSGRIMPGSSGSPFFDSNKRIRGIASYLFTDYCSPAPDCYCSESYYIGYTKFSSVWNDIDDYLDPINSNVTYIDGTRGSIDIELKEGANLVSFYALPADTSVSNIFSSVEGEGLTILGEGSACIWDTAFDGWIGSLTNLNRYASYYIIVNSDVTLHLDSVTPLDPELVYNLHEGGNLVSFPKEGAVSLSSAMQGYESDIINIVSLNSASMYNENSWFGSLTYFQGGKGYWFFVSEAIDMSYNLTGYVDAFDFGCMDQTASNFSDSATISGNCEYQPPNDFQYSYSTQHANYQIDVVKLNDLPLDSDDWVGAFNGDVCVGAKKWDTSQCNNEKCTIMIYGYDGWGYSEGYMNNGDTPSFKIYDQSEGAYYNAVPSTNVSWSHFSYNVIDELASSVWYVSDSDGSDLNIGNQENPFATIQHGINIAEEGQIVLVAPGTYSGEGNIDLDFNGNNITLKSEAGPESTIIDCDGSDERAFTFENGEDSTSVLDGFTIINGNRSEGGGIYCYYSSPTIKNCNISNCNADDYGGGMYLFGSYLSLTNVTIINNLADYGGGMYLLASYPILNNVIISENTADIYGGGMRIAESEFTMQYVTFNNNECGVAGSAIDLNNSDLIITNSTIYGHSSQQIQTLMYLSGENQTSVIITNSIIWGNLSYEIGPESPIITYSNIEGGIPGTGNIDTDPLFTDPENSDFSLLENSPCVDAGTADTNGDGIDDITDYLGTAPDMGAIESPYSGCSSLGDLNGDGGWNVLDIVALANCVLAGNCIDQENACAGDMNGDGGWNILDIVALANCILTGTCGG